MPPIAALLICLAFTFWLLRGEAARSGPMPRALWIPCLWLLIYGSRPVGRWLGTRGSGSETDGNPVDATIIFILICAAFVVLQRRRFQWRSLPSLNLAFVALLLY